MSDNSWMLAACVAALLCCGAPAEEELWRVGAPWWTLGDGSNDGRGIPGGFADFSRQTAPVAVTTDAKRVPGGLHGERQPRLDLEFAAPGGAGASPAPHGAILALKVGDATDTGPQVAAFVNGRFAGLIQTWGTAPAPAGIGRWRKTYALYLPPDMVKAGRNVLSLRLTPPLWSGAEAMNRFWVRFEKIAMAPLAAAPREAIHGKMTWLGTTMKHNGHSFTVDARTVRMAELVMPWLGIAYCGNTMRADYWYDLPGDQVQPARRALLEKFRDLNATVLADHVGGHIKAGPDGGATPQLEKAMNDFYARYGDLVQFYELGNEPCMFGGGYVEYLMLARWMFTHRPAHLQIAAAGWAYGGNKGAPVNWDADVNRRGQVEAWCDLTNGHSYGSSYNQPRGGSFIEALRLYGRLEDGWPKPFINSETGTNDWHSEKNGPNYPSAQPQASAFDRILRAHVAVVDRTMQHALIFEDFGLFDEPSNWDDLPGTLKARPYRSGEMPRIAIFRRLALAYATHGAPLPYRLRNAPPFRTRWCWSARWTRPPSRASRARGRSPTKSSSIW